MINPREAQSNSSLGLGADLSDSQLEAYQRDGYLIVRGLFSSVEVDAIREAFMEASQDDQLRAFRTLASHREVRTIRWRDTRA